MKERIVPIQFQEIMLNEIEGYIKEGFYASKAEFIREAVRNQIIELRKKMFSIKLEELRKISKVKGAKYRELAKKEEKEIFNEIEEEIKSKLSRIKNS